jgi:hypothetical protein
MTWNYIRLFLDLAIKIPIHLPNWASGQYGKTWLRSMETLDLATEPSPAHAVPVGAA